MNLKLRLTDYGTMGAITFSLDLRLVKVLQLTLPLRTFVETGTYKGETVSELEPYFDKIISVEISESLWEAAHKRFAQSSRVQILKGRSQEKLDALRNELKDQGVLYWLDAHWCVDPEVTSGVSECPLMDELGSIGKLNDKSVVLIDDARLFLAPPLAPHDISHWPTFNELLGLLRKLSLDHELMVINDVIAFYPRESSGAMREFATKNGFDWLAYGSQLKAEKKNAYLQEKSLNSLRIQLNEKERLINEKERLIISLVTRENNRIKWLGIQKPWIVRRIGEIFRPRLGHLRQYLPRSITKLDVVPIHPDNTLFFSIVTPSYGQGSFIGRTIESVLNQDYPFLEYFVQDGASKDSTLDEIKLYEDRLAGWESKDDGGQSQAINRGFQKTSGEIMCWLNSDDLLLPGALRTVSNFFQENPTVDVVYGNRLQIDVNDQEIGRWIIPGHDPRVLSWADYIPQETLFWRRSIWEKIGGQVDESFSFAMDWDLLIRFKQAGANFAHIPRFLGAFRIHDDQKTSSSFEDVGRQEMERIRERTLGYAPKQSQIRRAVTPFLLKHLWVDMLYRIRSRMER